MPKRLRIAPAALLLALPVAAQEPAGRATIDWQPFLDGKKPNAEQLDELLLQLTDLLGHEDPKLRDATAYTLLYRWIRKDRLLTAKQLRRLLSIWQRGLTHGLVKGRPNDVLRRSFSALCLALLVMQDNDSAFLTKRQFEGLLAAAQRSLVDEPDHRGYDDKLGYVHATAHSADLLHALARSRRLDSAQQAPLAAALLDRIAKTKTPFIAGEDDRLARAFAALAARKDAEHDALTKTLTSFLRAKATGSVKQRITKGNNRRLFLFAAYTRLALDKSAQAKAFARRLERLLGG